MKALQINTLTYLPSGNGYYTTHLQTRDDDHFELRIETYDLMGTCIEVYYQRLPDTCFTLQDLLSYTDNLINTDPFIGV